MAHAHNVEHFWTASSNGQHVPLTKLKKNLGYS